jgi:hypothetical protein
MKKTLESTKGMDELGYLHSDTFVYGDKKHIYFLKLNWDAKFYNILAKFPRYKGKTKEGMDNHNRRYL